MPFATDPKILKSMVGFFLKFFREKNIKEVKTEKYQPKEGEKKKILTDLPTFWHLKGTTTYFFLDLIVILSDLWSINSALE